MSRLKKRAFEDELAPGIIADFSWVLDTGLGNIIADPDSEWFDDAGTKRRETRKEMMELAMKDAVKTLDKKLGRDSSRWKWGELQHPYLGTMSALVPVSRQQLMSSCQEP